MLARVMFFSLDGVPGTMHLSSFEFSPGTGSPGGPGTGGPGDGESRGLGVPGTGGPGHYALKLI